MTRFLRAAPGAPTRSGAPLSGRAAAVEIEHRRRAMPPMDSDPAPPGDRAMLCWPQPDAANPYLLRLTGALADRGVSVRASSSLARLCVTPRGARWLHVHWPEWRTQHPRRVMYRARARGVLALLDAARARGTRLAWTAHNLLGHDDPHPDLGLEFRRALLARCDVAFGHFATAEDDLRALGFRGRFALTPHPHFADDYRDPFADASARDAWRAAHGVPDDALLLASPGSMEPYKNLPALAATLRSLDDRRWRWIAAGRCRRPDVRDALHRAVDGDPRVTLHEQFQPRDELAALVAASDAVVLSYRAFYTSGAAVLALTLGAAVIGPARHHLGSFGDAPFFVPLDALDTPSLGAALASLRARPRSLRASAWAHARATAWPDVARTVDETLFGGAA